MLDGFSGAASLMSNPAYWVAVISAVLLAAGTGIIPGFSAILVMALAIPFIVNNVSDPVIGVVLLATITGVNNTLDSIPAVLMGNPSAATQVTFFEGSQLAKKGRAAYTLGGIYAVSAMGGVIGAIALLLIIPVIRPVILAVSFPEITALAMFGVVMVSALSRGAMLKGLGAGMAGILFGTVGLDPITGSERFTFGQVDLWGGLPIIATTIGFFAIPEMIDLSMTRKPIAPFDSHVSNREVFRGARDGLVRWKVVIRQSLFGAYLGAVPGVGAAVIDWLSYVLGIFFTKDKSEFGKGSFDGVLFAEAAQNAKEGGQAIPTLALGVPGGLAWALVLAGLLAYNIAPGPILLDQRPELIVTLVVTLAIGNLFVTVLGLLFTGQLAKLTLVPYPLIGAIIIPISILTAFIAMNSWIALPIVFASAGVGLVMKMSGWPRPPFILGFILGPIIEGNFQSAYSIYGFMGIATRPLSIILFLAAFILAYFFYRIGATATISAPATAGGSATQGGDPAPRPRFAWRRWDNLVALGVLAIAAWFLVGSLDLPVRSQMVPKWSSIAVIALAGAQLLRNLLTSPEGGAQVMDIGMRSFGMSGVRTAAVIVAGLLALFVLVSLLIGLRYAGITYAVLGPLSLGQGRWRWAGAVVAPALVWTFTFIIADRFAAVFWPDAILGQWILDRF